VSYARRRPHRTGTTGAGPGEFYRRRQRRRERALLASTAVGPTLGQVAQPEALIAAYDALAAHGGKAPGPDGLTYADLGRGEACAVLCELSPVILGGEYTPSAGRKLAIPKPGGGTRTLTIDNIIDRVVAAALARALTPLFEAVFLPCSYGFRPNLGTWDLLADLMASMTAVRITTLAVDDVRKAFDHVPIAPLMETFREHITDPSLLQLVEMILRGGEDRGRAAGIAQGSPLSPLALNVMLHHAHDLPLEADRDFPPLFRFADNLTFLCAGVPEGHQALDRVRQLLARAGLTLKGQDGPPVDLREGGSASLLGFRLSMHEDRLRMDPGEDAQEDDMAPYLIKALDGPDPHRAARTAMRGGWRRTARPSET